MGVCVKCGQETKHEFEYYSANVTSQYTGRSEGLATTYDNYNITYSNFNKHQDFYCSQHTAKDIPFARFGGLGISIVGIIALFTFLSESSEWWAYVLAGFMICLGLGGFGFSFSLAKDVREDKRPTDGVTKIIEIRKQEDPEKSFYTVDEYNKIIKETKQQ